MDHRAPKIQLYAQLARMGKALASPARLDLLDVLAQGERPLEGLAQEARLSAATTSTHLQVLAGARLMARRKAGSRVHCRLTDTRVYALRAALCDTATAHLAELEWLGETHPVERQTLEHPSWGGMPRRLTDGETIVLDVRPALECQQGHIARARPIPLDELEGRLNELDPRHQVVAHCRDPCRVLADEAVALLSACKRRATRYAERFPRWAAAGLSVVRDSGGDRYEQGGRGHAALNVGHINTHSLRVDL